MISDILATYYKALEAKHGWEDLIDDDIRFTSRAVTTEGKEAFVEGNNRFLRAVKSATPKQMLVDGDTACVWVSYDLVSPKGSETKQDVLEIWTEKGGRLASSNIYFDTAGFRAFMSQ